MPHCDRKWRCPISDRTIRRVKHGCIDADETLTDEADSLAARVPELVDRWDAADNHAAASAVPVTSKRTWSWRCPQHGETWSMSIRDARRAQPCGQCRREKIGRSSRERWASQGFDKTILDDPTLIEHWLPDENEVRPDSVSATDKTYRRWFSCSVCSVPTRKTPKAYSLSPRCRECSQDHRLAAVGGEAVDVEGGPCCLSEHRWPTGWTDWRRLGLAGSRRGLARPHRTEWIAGHQASRRTHAGSTTPTTTRPPLSDGVSA